jgi:hypothetical protein
MDPAFAAQFLKIQQTFVSGLAQRLQDIQQAPGTPSSHVALHRLAGAAGGYGFGGLSLLAREAMDVLDRGSDASAVFAKLADAIAHIQSEA